MKYTNIACAVFGLFLSLFVIQAQPVFAQTGIQQLQNNLGNFAEDTGIGSSKETADNFKTRIANVINIILGFLGIIAVVFVMAGGFKWISAGGNADQVTEAQGNIKNAVIGLAIVLASYIIINFAISQLGKATGVRKTAPVPTQPGNPGQT